ncbi:hypothetical protein HYX12_04135 [Candidatus Woesearchaeota archaeon]|nr:hypothetical protein [Candidatus Woesearchaeota archaeon]
MAFLRNEDLYSVTIDVTGRRPDYKLDLVGRTIVEWATRMREHGIIEIEGFVLPRDYGNVTLTVPKGKVCASVRRSGRTYQRTPGQYNYVINSVNITGYHGAKEQAIELEKEILTALQIIERYKPEGKCYLYIEGQKK